MPDDSYETNLLRAIAAELYFLAGLNAAREMFGKSYFALVAGEKASVDQAVLAQVGTNYQALTPEFLKGQATQPKVGFSQPDEKKS
jgi:hypothetical protein